MRTIKLIKDPDIIIKQAYKNKIKKLNRDFNMNFPNEFKIKPILAKSDEWFKFRKNSIGGSQITEFIRNPNKFKSSDNDISHLFPLVWGTVFENVAVKYLEMVNNIEILGRNIYIRGENIHVTYSPDGFMEDKLIEIKCPITRKLGKILKKYTDQVMYGLSIIHEYVDSAVLYEFDFKVCRQDDFNWSNKFNELVHKVKDDDYGCPVAIGYIFCNNLINMCYSDFDKSMVHTFLVNSEDKKIYLNTNNSKPKNIDNDCGYICFKLFEVKETKYDYDDEYFEDDLFDDISEHF